MTVSFVVAFDEQYGIGKNNDLPWNMPNDMKRFKDLTRGHSIIMGRKTYDSMGQPLPRRRNIVVTRKNDLIIKGVEVVESVQAGLDLCRDEKEVFIIGGEEIFRLSQELANKMYLTKIHHIFDCDTFFPVQDFSTWNLIEETNYEADKRNPYPYSFYTYVKRE